MNFSRASLVSSTLVALVGSIALTGCGPAATAGDVLIADAVSGPDGVSPDGPANLDDVGADAIGADAVSDPDAALGDGGAPSMCSVPSLRVSDTAEARAFFEGPARCGQPAFRMLTSEPLGQPGTLGVRRMYAASVLRALAMSENVALPAPIEFDVTVDQIAYTTQDRGRPIEATTLVTYPRNVRARRDFEVLLFLHGTSGFTDACGPSGNTEWQALTAALASMGYVVIAPDYVGMRAFGERTGFLHPYLVGSSAAVASLDALRAGVRHVASQRSNACARARYVTIGGSQGGHAALWVDRIAGHYAPEYELMGTIATVPPADLEAQSNRALREMVPATANTVAFLTTVAPWYGLGARLGEVLREPYATDLPPLLATSCSPGSRLTGATREMVFTQAILDAAASAQGLRSLQPWGCLATENSLTATTVARAVPTRASYGVLWVGGENDTLVNTPIERRSFETLCAQGYAMQYLECAGASHTGTTAWALPEIVEFARARFDERVLDPANRCRINAPTRCRGTPTGS